MLTSNQERSNVDLVRRLKYHILWDIPRTYFFCSNCSSKRIVDESHVECLFKLDPTITSVRLKNSKTQSFVIVNSVSMTPLWVLTGDVFLGIWSIKSYFSFP